MSRKRELQEIKRLKDKNCLLEEALVRIGAAIDSMPPPTAIAEIRVELEKVNGNLKEDLGI